MGLTNEELEQMTYEELCKVKPTDMTEYPPILGLGFPYTVGYNCKFCGKHLEGSERKISGYKYDFDFICNKIKKNERQIKDVRCPYCNGLLWDSNKKHSIRLSAFPEGHFEIERKKRYLKHLKELAKRKNKGFLK